jgi:hypothetical protein
MRLLRDNGLTIVLVLTSLLTIGGMLATGWAVYNEELVQHQATPLTLFSYAKSGHFLSALFENNEARPNPKTPTSQRHRMKTLRKKQMIPRHPGQ